MDTANISRKDRNLIEHLLSKINNYIKNNKNYAISDDVVAVYNNLDLKDKVIISEFEDSLGNIQGIEDLALYDELPEMSFPYKEDFDKNVMSLKYKLEKFLADNPEDPYAWPFEEYK